MTDSARLLRLLVGAVVVDTVIIGMNYARVVFVSDQLTRWYTTMRLSAMLMDVGIIVLYAVAGCALARGKSRAAQIGSIVLVQVVGDLAFYAFFRALPRGTKVFDLFQDYAAEVGAHALWADAVMMVGTYLVAEGLAGASDYAATLALLAAVYVSQYVLQLK